PRSRSAPERIAGDRTVVRCARHGEVRGDVGGGDGEDARGGRVHVRLRRLDREGLPARIRGLPRLCFCEGGEDGDRARDASPAFAGAALAGESVVEAQGLVARAPTRTAW